MKCVNCDKDANFFYDLTKKIAVPYCADDLPSFLILRRTAGLLRTTETHKQSTKDALLALSTDVVETVTE